MTATVIVELDGSPVSEAALPYARRLCERTGAELAVVSVVPVSSAPPSRLASSRQRHGTAEDRTSERRRYLDQITAGIEDITLRSEVCVGDPACTLASFAGGFAKPLLVTTRREWASATARGGRAAVPIKGQTPVPLLVVPPPANYFHSTQQPSFERVLVPISSSRLSTHLISATLSTLGSPLPHLYLLWTTERPRWAERTLSRGLMRDVLLELDTPAVKQAEAFVRRLQLRGHRVTWIFSDTDRRKADHIQTMVERFDVDLIALETCGRGGAWGTVGDGYEEPLVGHAGRPILIFSADFLEQMPVHTFARDPAVQDSRTARDGEPGGGDNELARTPV